MYKPIRIDYGVPVYSLADINNYGLPEDVHRIWNYSVIDLNDAYVMDYKMCCEHGINPTVKNNKFNKPVHHYKRMDRFTKTMNNFLCTTQPPEEVVEVVFDNLIEQDEDTIWCEIEAILSKHKLNKYTDKIPWMLKALGFDFITSKHNPLDIYDDFQQMSINFDKEEFKDRKYFPKMRYVCIRLLCERGVEFGYHIPLVKTPSRREPLNVLFNKLRSY